MAVIEGVAKRYNGTAIDYVQIFNWTDGKCIAQVTPDLSGAWSYEYNKTLKVGVTYVANGCEPITHGAYDFAYEASIATDTILHYSFNGDALDQSVNVLNGVKTGSASYVTGRKVGTQALEFISGCVQTPQALIVDSDKLTVSFWMSTSQTGGAIIYEATDNSNNYSNTYSLYINDRAPSKISSNIRNTPPDLNISNALVDTANNWQHCVIEMYKNDLTIDKQKIYINDVLVSELDAERRYNTSGQFVNAVLYIGQRGASVAPFVGKLQDFRVYNRVLTADERLALFNE